MMQVLQLQLPSWTSDKTLMHRHHQDRTARVRSHVGQHFTTMLARKAPKIRNEASADDVAMLVKRIYGTETALVTGMYGTREEFADAHCEFMIALLDLTKRPTREFLSQSVRKACGNVSQPTLAAFSGMLVRTVSSACTTLKSTSTGTRLAPCVSRIVSALHEELTAFAFKGIQRFWAVHTNRNAAGRNAADKQEATAETATLRCLSGLGLI